MPQHLLIEEPGDGIIGVWNITESLDELVDLVNPSPTDLNRMNAFKIESRKREWLGVRLLVKELLGTSYQIEYRNSGAPYLVNTKLHVGISHTNGFAGIALSPAPTALDMEKAAPRIERVYQRFVSALEEAYIPASQRMDYFNLIWAAKETLYKLIDRQQVIFKSHFLIDPFELVKQGQLISHIRFEDIQEDPILNYQVTPHFSLVYHLNQLAI